MRNLYTELVASKFNVVEAIYFGNLFVPAGTIFNITTYPSTGYYGVYQELALTSDVEGLTAQITDPRRGYFVLLHIPTIPFVCPILPPYYGFREIQIKISNTKDEDARIDFGFAGFCIPVAEYQLFLKDLLKIKGISRTDIVDAVLSKYNTQKTLLSIEEEIDPTGDYFTKTYEIPDDYYFIPLNATVFAEDYGLIDLQIRRRDYNLSIYAPAVPTTPLRFNYSPFIAFKINRFKLSVKNIESVPITLHAYIEGILVERDVDIKSELMKLLGVG